MRKIILTSAGFENPRIREKFLQMTGKGAGQLKALWIPTAAIDEDARAVLPKCRKDLTDAGILPEHIRSYDLDGGMTAEELSRFDVVYVCGGDCRYLLDRMKEDGFTEVLPEFLRQGGVYVGVSAGSRIGGSDFPDGLGFLPCQLLVHREKGTAPGSLGRAISGQNGEAFPAEIELTNDQAVILEGDMACVFE